MKPKNSSVRTKGIKSIMNKLYTLFKEGEEGTIEYFCEKTDLDKISVICGITELENRNKIKLLRTEHVQQPDGSSKNLFIYGLNS